LEGAGNAAVVEEQNDPQAAGDDGSSNSEGHQVLHPSCALRNVLKWNHNRSSPAAVENRCYYASGKSGAPPPKQGRVVCWFVFRQL